MRVKVSPPTPALSACGAVGAHTYADSTCLRLRCAGNVPSIDTAHRRYHRRRCRRRRRRPTAPVASAAPLRLMLTIAFVRAVWYPAGSDPRQWNRMNVRLSFVGGCTGYRWGAVGPSKSTFLRFGTRVRAILSAALTALRQVLLKPLNRAPGACIWSWHVVSTVPIHSADLKGPYFV